MMIGLVNAILFIKFVQTAGSATAYPCIILYWHRFLLYHYSAVRCIKSLYYKTYQRCFHSHPDRNHLHHLLLNKGAESYFGNYFAVCVGCMFCCIRLFYSIP